MLECVDETLGNVVKLLGDMHDVDCRVSKSARNPLVTIDLRRCSLEQALDMLCLQRQLAWETDGRMILIGTAPEVQQFLLDEPGPEGGERLKSEE